MTRSAMFQFPWPGPAPSTAQVADRFGLGPAELDAAYGVVLVDPAAALYVVRVDVGAAARVRAALSPDDRAAGAEVYADPEIGPADQ